MPPHADTFHSTPFHFFDPFVQCAWPTVTYYEWDLSFFYLFACFVNLFKTTLWFLRPFEPLLFILSLFLSVMILFLQQHKSPKEIQENETVAHLALNAFCCGWQLCQTSFVYHMYVLLYHMICILCVCVCWNSYLQNSYFSFIYFRSYKL